VEWDNDLSVSVESEMRVEAFREQMLALGVVEEICKFANLLSTILLSTPIGLSCIQET
jgi:hypothetical protein